MKFGKSLLVTFWFRGKWLSKETELPQPAMPDGWATTSK